MSALITTPEELELVVERAVRKVMGEKPAQNEPDLNTEQIATELGLSEYTVREYAKTGRLHGTRQGTRWRFKRADVEDYKRGGALGALARRITEPLLETTSGAAKDEVRAVAEGRVIRR